jgi:hypothetical protein
MHVVHCSWAGFVLAQCARAFGTAFAPWSGKDVPVTIALHPQRTRPGILWDRFYFYRGSGPVLVRSTKALAADGVLTECVGGGFGMRLDVYEENRALHFRSTRYFWRLGRWEIALPHFVTPGIAHVVHSDLGAGCFRFEMTISHPWLGTLFHQDGVFHAEGEMS